MIKGFDAEFQDLDQYIRVITDRIWEGRRLADIATYYSSDCAVETPASVSIGTEPVIEGTRRTLATFPDRRLLAEDVLVSGDEDRGFLSSHRIFSPMTHVGPGAFGPATGRSVHVRTIADCVCIHNRIVHEWLVRDQAAIARAIGRHEREVAADWLQAAGGWHKPPMPEAPAHYVPCLSADPLAQAYDGLMRARWGDGGAAAPDAHTLLHEAVIAAVPGGEARVGVAAVQAFWQGMAGALHLQSWCTEQLSVHPRPGRATALALRWRAQTRHAGAGRYGPAGHAAVEVLGISHAEVEAGQVVREWHLIDDVALWMQVLARQGR